MRYDGVPLWLAGIIWACLAVEPVDAYADPDSHRGATSETTLFGSVVGELSRRLAIELKAGPSYVDFYGSDADNDEVTSRFRLCGAVDAVGSVAGVLGVTVGFYVYRRLAIQIGWARTCRGSSLNEPSSGMDGGTQELSYNEYSMALRYGGSFSEKWRWYPLAGVTLAELRHAYSISNDPMLPPIDLTDARKQFDYLPFLGIGVAYQIHRRLYASLEVRGHIGFRTIDGGAASGAGDVKNRSLSVLLGLRWASDPSGPDADRDGIPDQRDHCPVTVGNSEMHGCPDADADAVPDRNDRGFAGSIVDRCLGAPGPEHLRGCPDADGDDIPDIDDQCPKNRGSRDFQGCAHGNRDAVSEPEAPCPVIPGPSDRDRCPDSDGDGFYDLRDDCPEAPGALVYRTAQGVVRGCPDADGDRIPDKLDSCPSRAESRYGFEDGDGCPDKTLPQSVALFIRTLSTRTRLTPAALARPFFIKVAVYGRGPRKGQLDAAESHMRKLNALILALRECPQLRIRVRGSPHPAGSMLRARAAGTYLIRQLRSPFDARRIDIADAAIKRPKHHVEVRFARLQGDERPRPCK